MDSQEIQTKTIRRQFNYLFGSGIGVVSRDSCDSL